MSRLIDADALTERLNEYANDDWNVSLGGVFTDAVDTCLDFVENAPTIEAVPVVERNKIVDEFFDEVLNFEDYIEPITDDNGILLYSGCDITDMIVKIKKKFERSNHEKTD